MKYYKTLIFEKINIKKILNLKKQEDYFFSN